MRNPLAHRHDAAHVRRGRARDPRPRSGDPHRPTNGPAHRAVVRDQGGDGRRPGAGPGCRGPGLADVPQPRLAATRGRIPLSAPRGRRDREPDAPGRRQGAARQAAEQGGGPEDLRGDRPAQARPGPSRVHGPRALSDAASSRSLPAPSERSRCATRSSCGARATWSSSPSRSPPRSSPASRSNGWSWPCGSRARRRSSRSTAPATRSTSTAHGDHEAHGRDASARRRAHGRLPAALHAQGGGRRRHRAELPTQHPARTATSCSWPARRSRPAKTDTPTAKTVLFVLDRSGSMSGKKIEQARESLKFVLEQPARRTTCSTSSSTTTGSRPSSPSCSATTPKAAGRHPLRREHPRRREHQHRRGA